MTFLIDTHWIASFLNGRPDAVALLLELNEGGLALSIISYGETYEGLVDWPDSERRIAALERLVETTEMIAPDPAIAREYARVRSRLRSIGQLIGDNDLWIAATALVRDLVLVSRDQHFDRIPELRRYQPDA